MLAMLTTPPVYLKQSPLELSISNPIGAKDGIFAPHGPKTTDNTPSPRIQSTALKLTTNILILQKSKLVKIACQSNRQGPPPLPSLMALKKKKQLLSRKIAE